MRPEIQLLQRSQVHFDLLIVPMFSRAVWHVMMNETNLPANKICLYSQSQTRGELICIMFLPKQVGDYSQSLTKVKCQGQTLTEIAHLGG